MIGNRWKRRRANLMATDPHCYWCRKEVIYYDLKSHEKMPHNFATIEHLYDKYSPERRIIARLNPAKPVTVLACHECNQDRGDERTNNVPIELRRKWANR
jgi:hypothetical protein